uniref:MalT-like TPR region domain-containing protein n=1 Tax=Globisporangium ultimum (strain ATCC 200006 / CBS 805.95 / DAOM BR144) TaxID=431595 RepID=K3WJ29_GLOUD
MGTTSEAGAEEDLELMELDDDLNDDTQQQHPGHRLPTKTPKSEFELLEETRFIENQKELVALQRLDDKCTLLQQEGKYTEALECMEKGLVLRQHFFGAESDEVRNSCKTIGEMCNLLAMTYLQQEEFPVVLELLKKAEILTEKHQAGRAVTLNNFACYYRRQGNLHKSLTYLTEAITIETKLDNVANKADTHLNMCAVLSQLGKHQTPTQPK